MATALETLQEQIEALPQEERLEILRQHMGVREPILSPDMMRLLTPPSGESQAGGRGRNLLRNVFQNVLVSKGLRQSPTTQANAELASLRRIAQLYDLETSRRLDESTRNQRIELMTNPSLTDAQKQQIRNMSPEQVRDLYSNLKTTLSPEEASGLPSPLRPGTVAQRSATGDVNIVQAPETTPTSIQEYERAQADPKYKAFHQAQQDSGRPTSAIQNFNQLLELDPAISEMTPEQKTELFFKIIRQDPETAGAIAEAEAKGKQGGLSLTPGEKAVDMAFAVDYVEYKAKGGYADIERGISELDGAIALLESGDPMLTGRIVGRLPDFARTDTALDVRDMVERIVQRDLRATLGAQFTEKEGERLIARSYNSVLDEATNAKRVRNLQAAIREANEAKRSATAYWDEHGTLQGWTGELPTHQSIEKAVFGDADDYSNVSDEILIQEAQRDDVSDAEFNGMMEELTRRGN